GDGLAAARFADDAKGLAGAHAEADAVDRLGGAVLAVEVRAQVADVQQRGVGHDRSSSGDDGTQRRIAGGMSQGWTSGGAMRSRWAVRAGQSDPAPLIPKADTINPVRIRPKRAVDSPAPRAGWCPAFVHHPPTSR